MKVIASASPRPRARGPSFAKAVVGGGLLVALGALTVALIVTSGITSDVGRVGGSRVAQQLFGTAAWALAFLVPSVLVVLGMARIVRAVDARPQSRRDRPAASQRGRISDEYLVAAGLRLPDGRVIPEVVVGPHGLTIVEELPPARVSRRGSYHWEVRVRSGRWTPVEHPLDRAARDMERLRRWLGTQMEDYTPRFTAAVVADDDRIARTAEVAVLRREQLPQFLDAQPPLRQMTVQRRDRISALLQDLVEA